MGKGCRSGVVAIQTLNEEFESWVRQDFCGGVCKLKFSGDGDDIDRFIFDEFEYFWTLVLKVGLPRAGGTTTGNGPYGRAAEIKKGDRQPAISD